VRIAAMESALPASVPPTRPTTWTSAGLEALAGPQDSVERMLSEFRARRDLIVSGLNELSGVECIVPRGAFYAFPRVAENISLALERMDEILSQTAVR
jgi:aspartate aminotransferase